jgi:hypothetical protein
MITRRAFLNKVRADASDMTKGKTSYIVQSSIGMAVWIVLTIIVSAKVAAATQLAWVARIVIWSFLWALVTYFVYALVRYYRRLGDSSLE